MKRKTKQEKKRVLHDRAIRGWPEYQFWRDFAEFLETDPKPPEVLAYLKGAASKIGDEAIELVLRERYPSYVVLKRLKGE